MGPKLGIWSILGPAKGARFGPGTRPAGGAEAADGAPPSELEAKGALVCDILDEATRIASRGVSMFAPIRESCGLSGIEMLTLAAIAQAHSPPTVPQVGRSVGHPRQVIQRAVRVLEDAGLVRLLANPGHKRAALLIVTEKGGELGPKADEQALTMAMEVAQDASLNEDEMRALVVGLQVLRRRMDERLVGSAPVRGGIDLGKRVTGPV